MSGRNIRKNNRIFHPPVLILMALSILINISLSRMVSTTTLPFYIDTVGTIVATALGGIVPGMLTAFVTNVINFLRDGESIFYASLNILIAVVSSQFFGEYAEYKRKKKRKKKSGYSKRKVLDLMMFVFVIAFIGGGIGGEITWYLYKTPSDAPMIVSITKWLTDNMGCGVWGCHMISTYIADVADKAISVFMALIIIKVTPTRIKRKLKVSPWRQKPMKYEERHNARSQLRDGISIGTRINIIIILSTVLMAVIAFIFSVISFRNNIKDTLSEDATQIANLAAKEIDSEMIDEYIKKGYAAPGYVKTKKRLSILRSSASDITFLYVYKVEEDGCHVVFDLDGKLNDGTFVPGDAPGDVVSFEDAALIYRDKLIKGEDISTVLTNGEYGRLITAFCPIYNKEGKCVCYVIADVEYEQVDILLHKFTGRIFLLFLLFLILIVAISILTTRYRIVMPILGMTLNANELSEHRKGAGEDSLEKIEELDIRTGDEIERLYRALCNLTGDTVYQLRDNQNKADAIAKMQNALIVTMADMVESRDSDTGAHVLKTAAYVRIIVHGLKRNGYYAEKINEKYMRDVEMSAPLHDVGKINIPDAILNKPGKLTDEEFEIMKTHTIAGKQILESAISSMEGDNYLKEARNMAAYHHERWDGKGYPEGLHGEVIPLSARIMAVADVFDALSSPRVYKPAFSFEEAINMIKEGAGKQFDPKCVEVFVESIAEVKKVMNKYKDA